MRVRENGWVRGLVFVVCTSACLARASMVLDALFLVSVPQVNLVATGVPQSQVTKVFLSHLHSDHIADLASLVSPYTQRADATLVGCTTRMQRVHASMDTQPSAPLNLLVGSTQC